MAFNNLVFPFLLLPVSLLLCLAAPGPVKHWVMLLVSLVFFAWGSPVCLLLLACFLVFNYFTAGRIAQQLDADNARGAKITLITGVAADLLLLGFYKYFGFVLGIFGAADKAPSLPVPIGISFFTFSTLSYLFDVYRGAVPNEDSFLNFSLYVSFFPKLVSGPIVPWHEFKAQLASHPVTKERLGSGARKFILGLAKKLLIADALGKSFYGLTALPQGQLSMLSAWLGALLYSLMLYFDFSGYSDMAIGLAELFGFRFQKNFDYPYLSTSITEFWRRWHISLGAWFRDYVYIPLGGSRAGTGKTIRNLLIVWLLTGIWHGANWTFIVWGLYYGLLLLLEKFVFKSLLEHLPAALKRILTLLLVGIGWVFFFSPSLGAALSWIGCMFGIHSAGLANGATLYYLGSSLLLLIVAVLGATPLPARLGGNLLRSPSAGAKIASVAWYAVLLILCIAAMVSATYSSFLYFQF